MKRQAFTKHRVLIAPNNSPSNQIFNSTSFPNIQFVLGTSQGMLDPRTLRLNYDFQAINKSSPPVNLANNPTLASGATNGINVNNHTGSLAVIDQINVSSMNGRNIETIQAYNRYVSTFTPNVENKFDLVNTLSSGDPLVSSKNITTCRQMNTITTHSVPLRTGFLSGSTPINLSTKGFHGLNINIQLSQNSMALGPVVLKNLDNTSSVTTKQLVATSPFEYQLTNVFLTYDVYIPNDEIFNSMSSSGTLVFNSINTLTSTLLASDSTTTLRLGIKNCLSITHSTIPAVHLNNIQQDSLALSPLTENALSTSLGNRVDLNTIQYFRGGQLFPYNYILQGEEQSKTHAVQAQIFEPALHSVTLYDDSHHGMQPGGFGFMENVLPTASANVKGADMASSLAQTPDNSDFILGFACDSQRVGVDYSRLDYAFRINSNINGQTPFQFYTFARARNVAMYSPTGIEVLE